MTVRRLIAATALSAGVVLAVPGVAAAQSPAEVLPTQIQRAPAAAPLSRTGQDTMPMVYVGAGLAAAGAVIVVAARKRRDTLIPA